MSDVIPEPPSRSNLHLIGRIRLVQGDIVKQNVDAIVTTIPKTLRLAGKLNRDILEAAGQKLDDYILEHIYKPQAGDAFAAPGYDLPAKHVIFAVTPDWRTEFDRQDRDILQCYRAAMQLAAAMHMKTIAFPALITGQSKFPMARAARIAIQGIMDHIAEDIAEIRIVCYNPEAESHYRERLLRWGWKG